MKLTKSQKIWLSLLGVGVVALGVDQFRGSELPVAQNIAEAIPAMFVASEVPVAKGDPTINSPSALSGFDRSIAVKLQNLQKNNVNADLGRDAFAASSSWIKPPEVVAAAPDERASQFRHAHILKAVILNQNGGQAVVDSTLISAGQTLDGLRLVHVDKMHAVFSDGQLQTELRISNADLMPAGEITAPNPLPDGLK